jgi:hypothetical protein
MKNIRIDVSRSVYRFSHRARYGLWIDNAWGSLTGEIAHLFIPKPVVSPKGDGLHWSERIVRCAGGIGCETFPGRDSRVLNWIHGCRHEWRSLRTLQKTVMDVESESWTPPSVSLFLINNGQMKRNVWNVIQLWTLNLTCFMGLDASLCEIRLQSDSVFEITEFHLRVLPGIQNTVEPR